MTEFVNIKAELRERAGKGTARKARSNGLTPAVIYGDKKPPVTITLSSKELTQLVHKKGFFTHIYNIEVGGGKHQALARDVQFHPVTDNVVHVDFLRVSKNTKLTIEVPVTFKNENLSTGLKRGGVLNIVRHTIEVNCSIDNIPESFEIDLDGTNIGDSIHASRIQLPDGVTTTIQDRDFTVATIVAPTVSKASEEEEESTESAEGGEGETAEGGE